MHAISRLLFATVGALILQSSPQAPGRTAVIRKGDDPAKVLGSGKPDMGLPADLDARTRQALARVHTDPGEIPQLRVAVDGKTLDLPLEHTAVKAEVIGYVARVQVTQTYANPFAYPIEAIYVFPLPENSAVDAMKIVIGERTIEADIKKRAEARKVYEDAKQAGHTAALLEQERPNIFTQSVANIEPGSNIDVVIQYLQTLTHDVGEYEFVFPMVVGPRFNPGTPTGGNSGSGWGIDTHDVPDASRITPPVLGGGMRSGHDISLELTANAGLAISTWDVPTHEVKETPTYDGTLALRLAQHDAIANRDFVLRYRVDGKQPRAALLSHNNGKGGFFSLVVQPPRLDVDKLVGQRELIFVVDVSGSMHGVPLAMCKDAIRHAVAGMRPVDTFNVMTFAGRTGRAFERARPANNSNIQSSLAYIDGLRAGGGTQMLGGVQAALEPTVESGRHRYVFFLTDGYIGNEKQIFAGTRELVAKLERRGQRARVFGFGVGASVNRHLLEGISQAGKGVTVYASTREDPAQAVNTFYRRIDHPIMQDVEIDWGGLDVDSVYPARLPDLFATGPLIVNGRFGGGGSSTITVRGTVNGSPMELPLAVELPSEEQGNEVLATLWARAKINDLSRDLWSGPNQQVIEAITELGLGFHIVTAYTSLVAVDRSKVVQGDLRIIVQPVETPEGVNAQMAGAPGYGTMGGQGALNKATRGFSSRVKKAGSPRRPSRRQARPMLAAEAEASAAPAFGRSDRDEEKDDSADAFPGEHKRAGDSGSGGDLIVKGPMGRSAVMLFLQRQKRSMRRCIGGKAKAPAARSITLRWFVTAFGKVIQVKVMAKQNVDPALQACLVQELKSWTFPGPRHGGPTQVVYRFLL